MAFDPNNPPSLIASGIGGSRGLKAWAWKHSDPIATVIGSGYIRTARKLGMGVGDAVRYVDSSNDPHHLVLTAIDPDTGWGTVAFPETSPEAYPVDASPSGEIYVVAYVDGVQVRVDPTDLPVGALTYASQAEAEAGTDTDNPMNALRVFQGIAAYITGRAAKTPPVDADGLVITDSAVAGAPKQVTWANIKAAMFAAWGVLLAAATAKTTPVDADAMLLADSAASNATKKVTWANLKATVLAALGTTIAALTGKTTPVDADTLALSDSAAAGVGKSLTWANVKATLKAYFDTIYATGPASSVAERIAGYADTSGKLLKELTPLNARLASDMFIDYLIHGLKPDKISTNVLRLYPGVAGSADGELMVRTIVSYDINMAVTGVGGLDVGSPTNGLDYFVYVLRNNATGAFAAVISNSITYGGVTLPAGHTHVRKLRFGFVYNSAWDGIPNHDAANWPWPLIRLTGAEGGSTWRALNAGTAATNTEVLCAPWIPDNCRIAMLMVTVACGASAGTGYITSSGAGHSNGIEFGGIPNCSYTTYVPAMRVDSLRKLLYKVTGGVSLSIFVLGYYATEPS